MRRQALLVTLLVLTLFTPTASAAGQHDWQTKTSEHFVVEYKPGYEDEAMKVAGWLETARTQLLREMPEDASVSLEQRVHLRVYPGSEWDRSDHTLYWKDTDPVRIHVQAPSDAPSGLESRAIGRDWYEHGLAHEYANIVLWDVATDNAEYEYYQRNPSWFAEGLSEYYAYKTDAVSDQHPSRGLQQMNESIGEGNGNFDIVTDDRYDGGHLLAMYMIDTYGEDAVWDVLQSETEVFYDAVEAEFGTSKTEFENGWYGWAERNVGGEYSSESAERNMQQTQSETQTSNSGSGEDIQQPRLQTIRPGLVSLTPRVFFGILSIVAVLGILTGYLLGRVKSK